VTLGEKREAKRDLVFTLFDVLNKEDLVFTLFGVLNKEEFLTRIFWVLRFLLFSGLIGGVAISTSRCFLLVIKM
jgi:hypothetical protein